MHEFEKCGKLGIVVMKGAKHYASGVIEYLKQAYQQDEVDMLVDVECPRFTSGEAKALIKKSVRGYDLFILADVFNYSIEYEMYGFKNYMSPDDHYQDLKRIISAVNGNAKRINVIMPMLYEGRQHRCFTRESLDCAVALRELEFFGVSNFVTFDAHDERVKNAVPFMGFDNLTPAKNMIEALCEVVPDLEVTSEKLMIISPDEGAIPRCIKYSSTMGVELGVFYKRRDYAVIEDGKNPIVAHEFLGTDMHNRDVILVDDIIASGGSIVETAEQLKQRGAKRIFIFATFGLFTEGIEIFRKMFREDRIAKVFVTNLSYIPTEYKNEEWLHIVNLSNSIGEIIEILNNNQSMGDIHQDAYEIKKVLEKRR